MLTWLTKNRLFGWNAVEFFLLLAVVTTPFNNNLNSYFIASFCLVALLSNSFSEKFRNLGQNKAWILPLAYFLWMALSLIWDSGGKASAGMLEKFASFIIFPFFLGSVKRIDKNTIRRILFGFVCSIIIAALYCFWKSYEEYKATEYINVFFYHHLSMRIGLNAIYFSLYAVFSIWILLYYMLFSGVPLLKKALMIFAILFLVVLIVILASKMLIFILFLSLVGVIVYSFFYFKKLKGEVLLLLLFLVTLPFLMLQFPYVKARISETSIENYKIEIKRMNETDKLNGVVIRSTLWKAAWKLIKEKPVWGHGHYKAQEVLNEEYTKAGLTEAATESYNSHNQYLYTWAQYGVIGLLLITAYLLYFIKLAVYNKHVLAVAVGFIFLIANLTECMLEVQKGIVFYMLFSTLFLFHVFVSKNETKAVN